MLGCYLSARKVVEGIGTSPQEPDGTIQGQDTDEHITKVPPTIMDVVGATGIASAVATMGLTQGHIVDAACWTTMGLAPYAAYQKRELKGLSGMRGQQNILRHHVNTLSHENTVLHNSINELEVHVDALQEVEVQLGKIAADAQTNVNRLVEVVQEHGRLQKQIKQHLEKQVLQLVLSAVVQSDTNRDFTLGGPELDTVRMRLSLIKGLELDKANFDKVCPKGRYVSLGEIMAILRNLLDDDVPEEENIFHLQPRQILME